MRDVLSSDTIKGLDDLTHLVNDAVSLADPSNQNPLDDPLLVKDHLFETLENVLIQLEHLSEL